MPAAALPCLTPLILGALALPATSRSVPAWLAALAGRLPLSHALQLPGSCQVCGQASPWAACPACWRHAQALLDAMAAGQRPGGPHWLQQAVPRAHGWLLAWPYLGPWAQVVRRMKFHDQWWLAQALAQAWLHHGGWEGAMAGRELTDRGTVLVPVPQSPRSWRERGHSPTLAMAQALGHGLGLRVLAEGLRHAEGLAMAQHQLGRRERQREALGRLSCQLPSPPPARVILLDDVVTTGATLRAATHHLKQAGVHEVWVAALAWTPPRPHRAAP